MSLQLAYELFVGDSLEPELREVIDLGFLPGLQHLVLLPQLHSLVPVVLDSIGLEPNVDRNLNLDLDLSLLQVDARKVCVNEDYLE